MRVHVKDVAPAVAMDTRIYLDGEPVAHVVEADDAEGWVRVVDREVWKVEPESAYTTLRGTVRIELGDETGG